MIGQTSNGVSADAQSRHLEHIVLVDYNPTNDALIGRWDFDIAYGCGAG